MRKYNLKLILPILLLLIISLQNLISQDVKIISTSTNPLHVESSSMDNYIAFTNQNGYRGYVGLYNGDNDMDFGTGGGNQMGNVNLVISASPKLTIIPDGNIGIGVLDPDAKLEVNGQIKITGGTPGVGKVLTSDAVGKAKWAAPAPPAPMTYSVGDFAQGGVVFWVSANGQHGKVVSIFEMGVMSWTRSDGDSTIVIGSTGGSVKNGANNSSAIIMAYGEDDIYAARLCKELEYSGYDDWYLPAKDELEEVYLNRVAVNTTATSNGGEVFNLSSSYWSSTEIEDGGYYYAYALSFNGVWLFTNKTSGRLSRAIRAF